MLSRRSVRIKVMQLLYMLNRDEQLAFPDLVKEYNDGIWKTYELVHFPLIPAVKKTQYTEKDAAHRAAKHLPTDEDKVFSPRLTAIPVSRALPTTLLSSTSLPVTNPTKASMKTSSGLCTRRSTIRRNTKPTSDWPF